MPFQGSLNSLTLPDLISLVSGLRKTGTLSLVSSVEERGIVFYEGNVVYGTTRDFERRLGAFLVRSGAIDYLDLECAAEDASSSDEPFFGARLLDTGKIDEQQLREAVRAQVLDVMKEVLGWQDGVFFFDDAVGAFTIPEHGSISSQQIILEAARFRDEDLFATEMFPDRSTVLVQDPEVEIEDRGADLDHVLALLDGNESVGDVIMRSQLGPKKTAVVLKGLLESGGVIEHPDATGKDRSKKIEDAVGCPTAPHVPGSLFFQLSQDELPREVLSDLLRHEPLLAAKVLKALTVANAEIRRDQMSLDLLVESLGEFQLRSLLLPEAIRGLNYPTHTCFWDELWDHSRVCASVCEFVAEQVNYAFPGEAYVAGLLHNLGAFLLLDQDPQAYRKAVDKSIELNRDLEEIEEEIFGVNHTQLGARCAEKWNFPRLLLQSMRDHHKVEATVDNQLLHIVSVANGLAQASGYRVGFQPTLGVQFEDSLKRLMVNRQQAAILYAHVMRITGRKPEDVAVTA